jgi:putative endopeptidase
LCYYNVEQGKGGVSVTNSSSHTSIALLAVLMLFGLVGTVEILGAQSRPVATGEPAAGHGVDISILDRSCKPCEDFYNFASGEWLKRNPIPPAYPTWGRFSDLAENNRERLHQILENAAVSAAPAGSNQRKIGDFYASCMDETRIDAAGAAPLNPEFERIRALRNMGELQAEIARLHQLGVSALFEFGSAQDKKNSTSVIGSADQGGLGLPDRDYYKKEDDKSKQIRAEYLLHIARMLALAGDDPTLAEGEAKTIFDIEDKLAAASLTRVERRDTEKMYHKMNRDELRALTPQWSWDVYFSNIGAAAISSVDVATPDFFKKLSDQLADTPLSQWQLYLRWHLLNRAAPWLSQPFVDEDFHFKGRVLQGTQELLPRWKRCVSATDHQLGEALGQVYVQKYFPPAARARATEMVQHLIASLRGDLQTLPWMGPETRKKALQKLAAFTPKIGYPDKWRDYSGYPVDRASYATNQLRGNEFEFRRDIAKIGKPVDRGEWEMTPPTVNAYYSPNLNEIVFPAGILQPPFFDPAADDASNYGGMGAVIGHEMTHGFDDQGRKFDGQGNLRDWWTSEDEKAFNQRAECVEKQFDAYRVQDDLHENGKLVLGEAIADLGGLNIAYRALQDAQRGKPAPQIAGFSADQRFFLSYAQIWAAHDRPEWERLVVTTNPHPLSRFRAIAAPSNMPEFANAFGCQAGDAMSRHAGLRCQIW